LQRGLLRGVALRLLLRQLRSQLRLVLRRQACQRSRALCARLLATKPLVIFWIKVAADVRLHGCRG
jgi:hypothetical protein